MTRRVSIGKRADGSFGLSVSLPGVDVVTSDFNAGGFSFDDRWTDIVKIAMTGTANIPAGSIFDPPTVVSHGLGFVPFIEARRVSGSVLVDDLMSISSAIASNRLSGIPVTVDTSNLTFLGQQSGPFASGNAPTAAYSAVFVVYNLANPNPS